MRSRTQARSLFAAALLTTAFLVACGGSNSNSNSIQSEITGTVQIPNATVPDLTIASGTESAQAGTTGFKLKVQTSTFALLTANDLTSGKTVLIGMRDPRSSTTILNSANCANTLIFLSLGGSQMSPEERRTLWDRIAESTVSNALKTVLEAEIATDVFALENGNANIKTALANSITALSAASLTNNLGEQNTATRAPGDPPPSFIFKDQFPRTRRAEPIALTPGVAIDNLFSKAEGSYFAYNIGFKDKDGVNHSTVPAIVGSENKFNPLSRSTAIPLPHEENHSEDQYSLVVLQPIFGQPEPTVFNDSDYAPEIAKWRASLVPMLRRAYSSVMSASVLDAFGAPLVDFTPGALDESVAKYSEINTESAAIIGDTSSAPDLGPLVSRMAGVAAGGDSEAFSTLAAVAPLLRTSYPELADRLASKSLTSAQIQGFRGTMRILSALGSWHYSSKAGPLAETYTTGEMGKVIRGAMKSVLIDLEPSTSQFEAGKSLLLTAKPNSGFTNPFTYTWTLDEGPGAITNAVLNDNKGKVGRTITTTSSTVYLVTGNDSVGIARIRLEGESKYEDGTPLYADTEADYTPQGHLELSPIVFDEYPNNPNYRGMASGTWVIKPAPVNGVYAAAKLNIVGQVHGFGNTLDGKFQKQWNVPVFNGPISPTSKDPVFFTGTPQYLRRDFDTGPSSMGIGAIDYGDRILVINHTGAFDVNDPAYRQTLTGIIWQWANSTQLRYTLK
ncbi:hypothetical protein CCB80_05220 [Armatimonadetes bacterium Uphvl-Ar1]|nr:hypothetical protein CCB80_05220 [Armatimonadetes bacterium Uphvl-Ar1]